MPQPKFQPDIKIQPKFPSNPSTARPFEAYFASTEQEIVVALHALKTFREGESMRE